MKLATLKDEIRDSPLIVVSRDLKHAIDTDDIAPTVQAALDGCDYISPQLVDRYDAHNRALDRHHQNDARANRVLEARL